MSIYLIDFENTKNLTGIDTLSSDDQVIIFYSKNANTLTIDTHRNILSSNAKIEYKLVEVGKQNALDLQLSSYLGYLIKLYENTDCKFYIVARDKIYPFVATFWKNEKGIEIPILADLTGKTQEEENAENSKENTTAKKTKATTTKKATTSARKTKSSTTKKATANKSQSSTENDKTKSAETQSPKDESDDHSKINAEIENALHQSELVLKEEEIKQLVSCTYDPELTKDLTLLNNEFNRILKDGKRVPPVLKIIKPFIKNKISN